MERGNILDNDNIGGVRVANRNANIRRWINESWFSDSVRISKRDQLRIENEQLRHGIQIATEALEDILRVCEQSRRSPVAREIAGIIRKRRYLLPYKYPEDQ